MPLVLRTAYRKPSPGPGSDAMVGGNMKMCNFLHNIWFVCGFVPCGCGGGGGGGDTHNGKLGTP